MEGSRISLATVYGWARSESIDRPRFLATYRDAFRLSVARLAQALYREQSCTAVVRDDLAPGLCVVLGKGESLIVPVVPKPFVRFGVEAWPPCYRADGRAIRWSGPFLRALDEILEHSAVAVRRDRLRADFNNSLASLILSRLLAIHPPDSDGAPEPAWQGHHYYPFPGLRLGPSLEDVLACSNLSSEPVPVPLLEVSAVAFRSVVFRTAGECFEAWAGCRTASASLVIPLHPWQAHISPVVRALVEAGGARFTGETLACRPLASQRTFRVVGTAFDIKLAVDASLTSEHRLLFRLNRENAPAISALIARLLATRARGLPIEVQRDVATVAFADERVASHLAAIIRAPVPRRAGETVIPAIELWTGRQRAGELLQSTERKAVERFFRSYCRALWTGPLHFLALFGIAFEPHLQNTLIVLRGNDPVRLVLRDLDGTILDHSRVAGILEEAGAQLAPDTWDHMPGFDEGEGRFMHALFFGHLAEVVDFLVRTSSADVSAWLDVMREEWARTTRDPELASAAGRIDALCEHFGKGRSMLRTRLERSHATRYTDLPRHEAFPDSGLALARRGRAAG